MSRSVTRRYRDPLDELWIETARRIGFRIERADEVFASSDGAGVITIARAEHLDADDCLAQMIFHELCHSLVQGEESFTKSDWGLENRDPRDHEREHACLRAQAHLAARYGLREALAPTTDFRAFYDALAPDPLLPRDSSGVQLAVRAVSRGLSKPWHPHLGEALAATQKIARASAVWPPSSLFAAASPPPAAHSSGLSGGWIAGRRCGDCGWRDHEGNCQVARGAVRADEPACDRFESALDCAHCGACCREGYDSVTIEAGDPVATKHPSLLVDRGSYVELARRGGRCVALEGGPRDFSCTIYGDRPRCCRELERGGEHCLTARRRVGISI